MPWQTATRTCSPHCTRTWANTRKRCDDWSGRLIENPPMLIRDGGVIAAGYDADLDELRNMSRNADGYLTDLESRERERTGLPSLKVGFNRVHGYYIEISKAQAERAPRRLHSAPDAQGRGTLRDAGVERVRRKSTQRQGTFAGPRETTVSGAARGTPGGAREFTNHGCGRSPSLTC